MTFLCHPGEPRGKPKCPLRVSQGEQWVERRGKPQWKNWGFVFFPVESVAVRDYPGVLSPTPQPGAMGSSDLHQHTSRPGITYFPTPSLRGGCLFPSPEQKDPAFGSGFLLGTRSPGSWGRGPGCPAPSERGVRLLSGLVALPAGGEAAGATVRTRAGHCYHGRVCRA